MNTWQQLNNHGSLHHGGHLRAAAARFAIPLESWLDLSTGINANGWPVRTPPASSWARLPEEEDELDAAANRYYGTEFLLPVAGSQAAIQALPQLRAPSHVSVLSPGYAEHVHAWKRNHHTVSAVTSEQIAAALPNTDVLIIIHPNNPTGEVFSITQLLNWHAQLATRGGWLIVDEAFIDATPALSIASHTAKPGLIVLRSLGKFFGLAGARVGFVCAQPQLLMTLNNLLGPWTVSTPARWMAIQALQDKNWQEKARQQLLQDSQRLHSLLSQHHFPPHGGSAFFQWVCSAKASDVFEKLAAQGILTRLFSEPSSLRFGLPATEADWQRLDKALARI
ncbi:threonine-phosphate decarboxylase CobD [Nitrosomonas sp. Is37]|uniref:threonine-phosphate decarboxylase CobD n=1 Tax=Nitrosomonas sp. Is37 TaxID=3080535 RepID=UPI00294B4270|nr:threonine-phosphate decarboxylase CobD [Nitrosomonas sp. Is37]MDV6344667.1 threonine-phosphate decarboxylase CobD [Nitrosomonas sp. Is37]